MLKNSFNERFHTVLVPPWSQIRPDLVAQLSSIGVIGISSHRARHAAFAWPGIPQVNTQVDLIDWQGSAKFAGAELVCCRIASHLAAKRMKIIDDQEPTGILTHHKAHDTELARFLPELMGFFSAHKKVQWVAPFSPAAAKATAS